MKKNKPGYVMRKRLYVCPKCLDYFFSIKRNCEKCGCSKGLISVLKKQPLSIPEIPKEDWARIISFRKLNGYGYEKCEKYFKTAKALGVKIPRDETPSYIMKGLRPPKSQRGGFIGVANHAGASHYVRSVNGGGCSPK